MTKKKLTGNAGKDVDKGDYLCAASRSKTGTTLCISVRRVIRKVKIDIAHASAILSGISLRDYIS